MTERTWKPTSSALGIEYEEHLSPTLSAILLQAEKEWFENAEACYGIDAGEVWADDIFPRLLNGTLQDVDIEDLKLYAPRFLKTILGEASNISLTDYELAHMVTAMCLR